MNVFHYDGVEAKDAGAETSKVKIRWLIDEKIGAENFFMRMFEIEPEGFTPLHLHDWEHEVFILEGEGLVVGGEEEKEFKSGEVIFVPANELHQFKNNSENPVKFLCLIPYKSE